MKYFISPEELHANIEDYHLVDVQFVLGDEQASFDCYNKAHLSGSVFLNLESEVSDKVTELTGRHPLPPVDKFLDILESKGISPEQTIAVYDNFGAAGASRVWWMLTSLGFKEVRVMIGGIQLWMEKYPVVGTETKIIPSTIDRESMPNRWEDGLLPVVRHDKVRSHSLLVDSRNRERYNLEESGPDPVIGRIPDAINLPWGENLKENSELLPLSELQGKFQEILKGKQAVFYCGSGVSACFNILLAKELGLGTQILYPGSWSEWYKLHPKENM